MIGESTITLIDNTIGSLDAEAAGYQAAYGATRYNFIRTADNTALILGFMSIALDDSAKAYLEAAEAGLSDIAQGGLSVGTRGMQEMLDAVEPTGRGIVTIMEGGHMRTNTGSHVETDSVLFMGGPVWGFADSLGAARFGIFVEAGSGSYDSFNSFAAGSIRGDGDIQHYGLALLGRQELDLLKPGYTPYIEASARFGRVETDFASNDFATATGFEMKSLYYGGHLGLGLRLPVFKPNDLDIYAKAFWTHQEGDNVTTDAAEKLKIKDANSIISRVGARYNYAVDEDFNIFAGAAWEYEFDGKVKGTLNNLKIDPPESKGHSAYLEAGFKLEPAENNWNIGFTVHGNVGKREGIGGTLSLNFMF